MKKAIKHLPEIKQNELQKIVEVIRENCNDVEKIILFGSYARGNFKEKKDLREDRKSGHVSDYDILVVTEEAITALNASLWQKIYDECKKLNLSADPRILTHDISELNNKLTVGQYFYSDIIKEGILLFDSEKFSLAEKKNLNNKERQEIATEHFEHWFEKAQSFFIDFGHGFKRADYNKAAFELHQAAEHAYKTILLVFTLYNPNEHFLSLLSAECEKYFPALHKIFPKNTDIAENRFKLLE